MEGNRTRHNDLKIRLVEMPVRVCSQISCDKKGNITYLREFFSRFHARRDRSKFYSLTGQKLQSSAHITNLKLQLSKII
jgi:hypothetical protein